ncbi:hypothetical protein, partial [Klebsiella pneumoniae]|uniref:hypothetical protein n=1 Tax=Klebsiella pneumoniae TaxID=573 RepID=UPI0038536988
MPPELRPVLDRLAAEAERRYGLAASGIAPLLWSCRPAKHGARQLYRAIGRRAVRVDPLSHRAVVPAPVKLRLMLQACLAACLPDWR